MLRALVVRFLLAAAVVATLFATALLPARAQQPPSTPTLSINQVDASKYPDVRAVATVLDARGVPVSGLSAAQFQAFDGDTQLTVAAATAGQDSSLGLSVVIAIDISGSMAGDPLARAKQAATELAGQLGTNDEAAVVAFNQQVTPITGMTNDRRRLTDGIAGLQAGGGTALYEAAQTSAYIASVAKLPRHAVVLLTDGENDAPTSQVTADGSLAVATGSGVPFFTVGFGDVPDASFLQALSSVTQGGYRPATVGTISSVYADLATLLRNQYVVTIRALGEADGKDSTLQLIAFVAGTPMAAVAPYKRGAAPVGAALTQVAPAAQPSVVPATSSGASRTPALVFGGLVVAVILAVVAYAASRWYQRRRLQRAQLAIVSPNERLAAAQGVPQQRHAAAGASSYAEAGGRLIEHSADGAGKVYDLGAGPFAIGSSRRLCQLVLSVSDGVAPEHVRITLVNGAYRLHHTGGSARQTLVGGKPADFVTLEPGDEIQVDRHHFVFTEIERNI